MKSAVLYSLLLFSILSLISSCQKAPELIIRSPLEIEISANGGNAGVLFLTNRDWTVTSSESWLHVSISYGSASDEENTVNVRCASNTTYEDRSGKVIITAEGLTQKVTVNQPANVDIIVPTRNYELTSNKETIEVEIQSNVHYSVVISESWIKQTETKGLTSRKILFNIEENNSYDEREGRIIIKSHDESVPEQGIVVKQAGTPLPEYVDLDIVLTREDGSTYRLFWAPCNLGADKPEECGNYYAWGETEQKDSYLWGNYKWANETGNKLIKYCTMDRTDFWGGEGVPDNKTVLELEDDAAHIMLGGRWRIPTKEEMDALIIQCVWKWTNRNGMNGYEIKSKDPNNTSVMFFPAAGAYIGQKTSSLGSAGFYWTSSLFVGYNGGPYAAYDLVFGASNIDWSASNRYPGFPIRPVEED